MAWSRSDRERSTTQCSQRAFPATRTVGLNPAAHRETQNQLVELEERYKTAPIERPRQELVISGQLNMTSV